jgi:hypothetical protein
MNKYVLSTERKYPDAVMHGMHGETTVRGRVSSRLMGDKS